VRIPERRELVQRRLRTDLLPIRMVRARETPDRPRPRRLEGCARRLDARQRDVLLRIRKLGELQAAEVELIVGSVKEWLGM
jgi:hypothetical protein